MSNYKMLDYHNKIFNYMNKKPRYKMVIVMPAIEFPPSNNKGHFRDIGNNTTKVDVFISYY